MLVQQWALLTAKTGCIPPLGRLTCCCAACGCLYCRYKIAGDDSDSEPEPEPPGSPEPEKFMVAGPGLAGGAAGGTYVHSGIGGRA